MHSGSDQRLAEHDRRVLSNLQLLYALVGIRLRSVSDPESRRHLAWLNDMIAALEMLNRRLSGGGLAHFGAYLEEVAGFWSRAGGADGPEFDLELEPVLLDQTMATCIAIMVHELLGMAVTGRTGRAEPWRIGLRLAREEAAVAMTLSGLGPAEGRPPGLAGGLDLVMGLADHIGGAVESDPAAQRLTIRVPDREGAPRPH